jgi:N-acetylglutamate synthase-like GNAT family acetyltransferase
MISVKEICMIKIRLAQASDINWVNEKYKDINFAPSDISKELIAIAEIKGEKVGLGRLVNIDIKHAELGGMYVFDDFRNQGIARAIVDFLLSQGNKYKIIYCLPFEHLQTFYESFGFIVCSSTKFIPIPIKDKYKWCNQTYSHKVLLLQISKIIRNTGKLMI